jgi:hypothetical protein
LITTGGSISAGTNGGALNSPGGTGSITLSYWS